MTALREAGPADAEILARLYAASFADRWSADFFAALLPQTGVCALMAEIDGDAAGFILFRTVADEAEILTFAVHPAARRRGAGRMLAAAAARKARAGGADRIFLEVAVGNQAARALYEALGFSTAGIRKGYYRTRKNGMDGTAEDALVLRAHLPLLETNASQGAASPDCVRKS